MVAVGFCAAQVKLSVAAKARVKRTMVFMRFPDLSFFRGPLLQNRGQDCLRHSTALPLLRLTFQIRRRGQSRDAAAKAITTEESWRNENSKKKHFQGAGCFARADGSR